ncbi:MAG TPA: hypothetical protein VLL25_09940 [Acidimicrobiales bacterium]|nr:hypothetical protein [Acidimicrobiales bacterium]
MASRQASPGSLRLLVPLMAGVLLLEVGFIASYAGALHNVDLHPLKVQVVATQAQTEALKAGLTSAHAPVNVQQATSAAAAERALRQGKVFGVFEPGPSSAQLLVSSASGPAAVEVLTTVFGRVADTLHVPLVTHDLVPLRTGDPRGLVPFYLVIGWVFGGYLAATILGLLRGMTPGFPAAAARRLAGLAAYAIASGLVGVAVVDAGYGYLVGHPWSTVAIGALVVFAVAAATAALESVLGLVGTGLTIILFVLLGNPSAGGPWPTELIASPWRQIGPWLPNGAGLTAIRKAVYFGAHGIGPPLFVLAVYAIVGGAATLALSRRSRPFINIEADTSPEPVLPC